MPAAPHRTAPRQPSTIALALLATLTLLALAGLGWLWLTRVAPLRFDIGTATLADARQATWLGPLLGLGVALVAMLWVAVWARAGWDLTILPIAVGIIGVLALVLAGRALWQNLDSRQPIRIVAYTCDAGAARPSNSTTDVPDGCEIAPDPGTASIGTANEPDEETPDTNDTTANAFPDLPRGIYEARLTTTAEPDSATVILAAQTSNGVRPVSRLSHTAEDRWAGTIALHPNLETYLLLMYDSPYPAAPQATLRFTVQQCVGTTVANFDVTTCEPASMSAAVIEEIPPSNADDAGRPPEMTIEGDALVLANLEERTYTFTPAIRLAGNGILVIPSEDTQTADRTILVQDGAPLGTFTIDVTGQTRDRSYTIYLVDEGISYAAVAGVRR